MYIGYRIFKIRIEHNKCERYSLILCVNNKLNGKQHNHRYIKLKARNTNTASRSMIHDSTQRHVLFFSHKNNKNLVNLVSL